MESSIKFGAAIALLILGIAPSFAQDAAEPDLMSFAQGAVPVSVTSAPGELKTGLDQALSVIDGNPSKVSVLRKPATPRDVIEMTFSLPALTRFNGFSVPDVVETPSPSQTFVGRVEVLGSAVSADGPFVPLADGELQVHTEKGQKTELTLSGEQPEVLWVRLRLSGGTDLQKDKSFLEFSEIIGNGVQQEAPLAESFHGVFSGRGVKLELAQDGALVSGCYDQTSRLSGTVQGKVLRALGEDPAGVPSQFILVATDDGGFQGLRSSNGAPFTTYNGGISAKAATCLAPEPPSLGCGAIIHGIGFDFDSDRIRASSQGVLAELHAGLAEAPGTNIQIIGHSSSEGAEDYNRDLSQRRAASVVAALVALGSDGARLTAVGKGEDEPIASNADEAGRSLNRRVEVRCAG